MGSSHRGPPLGRPALAAVSRTCLRRECSPERVTLVRAIFGVVSLLVVLAIVALVATRQLRATARAVGGAVPVEASMASAASAATVGEQSQQLQQRVKADVTKALERGAAATPEAADK